MKTKKLLLILTTCALLGLSACTAAPSTSPGSPATIVSSTTVTSIRTVTATPAAVTVTASTGGAATGNFVSAVEKMLPSVVTVHVKVNTQGVFGQSVSASEAGTGFVFAANGLIVTNEHVIDGANSVTVTLQNGTTYTVSNIQSNTNQDLAVLKIDAGNLTPAALGDSKAVKLGQSVAVVGNALDMGIRVTGGLVSQLNATATFQSGLKMSGLIETDAAVNPGNSGGPLINLNGEIIGIINSGLSDVRLDPENFGFAISMADAMPVINQLASQIK